MRQSELYKVQRKFEEISRLSKLDNFYLNSKNKITIFISDIKNLII